MSNRSRIASLLTVTALCLALIPAVQASAAAPSGNQYSAIPNGEKFLDTDGDGIEAHGGYIIKHGGVYYWIGEDRSNNSATFYGVNIYRSTDLMNWTFVEAALTPESLDVDGNRVLSHAKVERPKLLFNESTGKFVLWAHWETFGSYAASQVLVATSDTVDGTYTIQSHFRPAADSTTVGWHVGETVNNGVQNADGSYPTKKVGIDYPMTVATGGTSNELAGFVFDSTVKAIATKTDSGGYPTSDRSDVSTSDYVIGTAPVGVTTPIVSPHNGDSSTVTVNANKKDLAYITDATPGASLYYTTDGTTPAVVSGALQGTTKAYAAGTSIALTSAMTIKAIAVSGGASSDVASVTFQLAAAGVSAPLYPPVISVPSGTYPTSALAQVKLYRVSDGTTIYFTTDGIAPNPPVAGQNLGFGSRDFTVFQDLDGSAYLISAQDDVFMRVYKLSADYTNVIAETEYPIFVGQHREAPALVHEGEYTYLITSQQSGWYPNQALFSRTKNILDPSGWSPQQPIGDTTTFHSQPAEILNVGSSAKPSYVYFGDRWSPSALKASTWVWLPLHLDNEATDPLEQLSLSYTPTLAIDVTAGTATGDSAQLLSLNKPVWGSDTPSSGDDALVQYGPEQANDGLLYDVDNYDAIHQYYQPLTVPFDWGVDLGSEYSLSRIDVSAHSVGGSDSATQYKVYGSNDKSSWTLLYDNSDNLRVGFQSNQLSGTYRYVKLHVNDVYDVSHGKSASWEAGLHEVSVYGSPVRVAARTTTSLAVPATVGAESSLTLGATVSPATAAGNVAFYDGPVLLGQAPLASGTATVGVAGLAAGPHSIVAKFAPDDAAAYAASATAPQTISAVKRSAQVTVIAGGSRYGTPSHATVTVVSDGAPAAGSVTVNVAGYAFSSALTNGAATIALPSTLTAGRYVTSATFAGNDSSDVASGNTLLTIKKAVTKTTISLSAKKAKLKKTKLSAMVKVTVPGTHLNPAGKLSFKVGRSTVKKVSLRAAEHGKIKVKIPVFRSKGTSTVTVTYSGTSDLASSTASTKVKVTR